MRQYPYILEAAQMSNDTIDNEGFPIEAAPIWVPISVCRDQSGTGQMVQTESGDTIVYKSVIHCPKGFILKPGDQVRVVDTDKKVRVSGNIIVFRDEQIHIRIWL